MSPLKTERKVVRKLIRVAKAHGFILVRVWDGEDNQIATTENDWVDCVFSVDNCRMMFRHCDEPKLHCAVIVLGNGHECIVDASLGPKWDEVMAEMNTYCDSLEARA